MIERDVIQRNALLISAKDQYKKFGFQQMTIERVLSKAELSKSVFYKFFKSKFDLIEEVLLNEADQLSMIVNNAMSQSHDKRLISIYVAAVESYFIWCTNNRDFCIKFVRDISNRDSPIPKVRSYCVQLMHTYWQAMSKELGLPETSLIQTDSFIHLIERYMYIFLEQDDYTDTQVVRDYIDSLLKITSPIVQFYESNNSSRISPS